MRVGPTPAPVHAAPATQFDEELAIYARLGATVHAIHASPDGRNINVGEVGAAAGHADVRAAGEQPGEDATKPAEPAEPESGQGEGEYFSDNEGNTYVRDDEGDYIPVDPQTGQQIGDYYIDGETRERGEFEGGAASDPRVDELATAVGSVLDHLNRTEINTFAEKHPDIREPEMARDVAARLSLIAERAGDPRLRRDPELLKQAYLAARAERAQPASVSAEEARHQGAPLESDAGADRSPKPDAEDQWWDGIKQAGGQAFPS